MDKRILRQTALVWVAYLLIIPNTVVGASTLREEAIAYRAKGYESQQTGDKAGALSWYQKAAALDPFYPTPHNDIGVLLEDGGRLEEAERSYLQALSLNPHYLESHANLAMLYERLGQTEKAIDHWMKRYQFGDPYDPWTARAEERLVALGVLETYPGVKGMIYTRRRLVSRAFQAHAQSLEEFRATTEEHGDWP
jgi:tetratricopeptide (TPR) repeat protein